MMLEHLVLTVLMLGLAVLPLALIARFAAPENATPAEEYDYR